MTQPLYTPVWLFLCPNVKWNVHFFLGEQEDKAKVEKDILMMRLELEQIKKQKRLEERMSSIIQRQQERQELFERREKVGSYFLCKDLLLVGQLFNNLSTESNSFTCVFLLVWVLMSKLF